MWKQLVGVIPGAGGESPGSGTVSKARQRISPKAWGHLFDWLSKRMQEQAGAMDVWRGLRVVLVDGLTVSMAATEELFKAFGRVRCKRRRSYNYPLARAVVLVLANSMAAMAYAMGAYQDSEVALLQGLLSQLHPGDLLIGDRGYAGANRYAQFAARGVQFITRVHQRLKVARLPRLISYGPDDFVTELKVAPHHRKADPSLPKTVRVRLIRVEAWIRGQYRAFWVATSLLDGKAYPAEEIAELYGRRWRVETFIRELKIDLGADVLRSATPDGVRSEMAARVIAANVVRSIMLEAARKHEVEPTRMSFTGAVCTVLSLAPVMATAPALRLPVIYSGMLREIARHLVPSRPGRNEPRAIRRDKRRFPLLTTTRKKWRKKHSAQRDGLKRAANGHRGPPPQAPRAGRKKRLCAPAAPGLGPRPCEGRGRERRGQRGEGGLRLVCGEVKNKARRLRNSRASGRPLTRLLQS